MTTKYEHINGLKLSVAKFYIHKVLIVILHLKKGLQGKITKNE